MNESAIATFTKYSSKPCRECGSALSEALTDPKTHTLMHPWVIDRQGLLDLHVHPANLLDDRAVEYAYFFVTMLSVHNRWILSATPSGKNIEDAVAQLAITLTKKENRNE